MRAKGACASVHPLDFGEILDIFQDKKRQILSAIM